MITFTPLAGSARSPQSRPLCYLLVIDDVRILLDCGSYPPSVHNEQIEIYYSALEKECPKIDLVLFSHGNLSHLGLYPYAHARWKLTAPAYSSIPVQAMGRMAVLEELEDIRAEEYIDLGDTKNESAAMIAAESGVEPSRKRIATRQEIHRAFDSVSTLRYSEPTHLGGKCQGITVTPFSAGHTLGGTIWKIRSPTSGTIVYAVDMNHTKERHLDGTVILRAAGGGVFEPLARPDLFITDAERALVVSPRRKDRDSMFLNIVSDTLATSNSVFIPCDASTRILELLVLLDQYWTFQRLSAPVCLVSKTGQEMLTYVRSMLDWMGGTVSKDEGTTEIDIAKVGRKRRRDDDDEEAAVGPLALRFKHVQFFSTPASLQAAHPPETAKVILAVPSNMDYGPSRSLFTQFVANPGNVVVLTSAGEPETLSHHLLGIWDDAQADTDKWGRGKIGAVVKPEKSLKIKLNSRVPLVGKELEDFQTRERERAAKEREAAQRAALARSQQLLEADEGDSDDESDSDRDEDDEDEMAIDRALGGEDQLDPGERSTKSRGKGSSAQDWSMEDGESARLLSFDIYLKGNVSKAASFFKTSTGMTQRFRMYPYVEKSGSGVKRRVDEFGETLDVGMWLRRGRAMDEDAESEEVKEAKRKKREEEEAKKAPPEPPSKFVTEELEVKFACQLMYIDLEGLNDGRSVKTIIPQVQPRRMIIVHAVSEATDALVQSCASIRTMTQQIYTPNIGEDVVIGQHSKTFSVSLADSLMASLKLSSFEDSQMAFLTGRVVSHSNSVLPVLEPLHSTVTPVAEENEDAPAADAGPSDTPRVTQRTAPLPRSAMIGDLKLTVLRSRLTALGLSAEFAGEGVLVCSGGGTGEMEQTVAVRKTGRGRVSVEGSTGDVYFTIRKEIYALHAMVAQL